MKRVAIYSRFETEEIAQLQREIKDWLVERMEIVEENPELVIVIGGDGGILAAVQKYHESGAEILGINRGNVGFLASVDRNEDHLAAIERVISGEYKIIERALIEASVEREGKEIFACKALNDVVVSSPLSVVRLEIAVDGQDYMKLSGTGVLVSTATGSTAYNLSAHGPILTPKVNALVITELLNHSVPIPSMVVDQSETISISVGDFKAHQKLQLQSGYPADVVLNADGAQIFSLQSGDMVTLRHSDSTSKFIALHDEHFFQHLHDKFEISR